MLYVLKINEEFQNKLLEEAKQNKEDMRGKLAGQIEKETAYSLMSLRSKERRLLPYMNLIYGVLELYIPSL